MLQINPYLNFNGNTEKAFLFYQSVFGGEFEVFQRFKDSPGCEEIAEEEQNQIMHVALPVGNNVLMGTDVPSIMPQVSFGNNFSISINVTSEEEATTLFEKLAQDGTIGMPLQKMFWGALYGMLTDKFGVQWMINYDYSEKI